MSIVMKAYMVEEAETVCPVVLCDLCVQPIFDGDKALYLWQSHLCSEDKGSRIYFIHEKCEDGFKQKWKGIELVVLDLRRFPVALGNNLNTDWRRCEGEDLFMRPSEDPGEAFREPSISKIQ